MRAKMQALNHPNSSARTSPCHTIGWDDIHLTEYAHNDQTAA